MFIWDFVAETILSQILDWVYLQILGLLGNFFAEMGSMGAELLALPAVEAIIRFFNYLAWALYGTGLVVAGAECGIQYASGRGSVRDTAMNVLKGFLACSLFSTVPVRLYELAVSLQSSMTAGITGYGSSFGDVALEIIDTLSSVEKLADFESTSMFGFGTITSGLLILVSIILIRNVSSPRWEVNKRK